MTGRPLQGRPRPLGGGLAGLCTGLELARRRHDVVILHAHEEKEIASWAAAGRFSPARLSDAHRGKSSVLP